MSTTKKFEWSWNAYNAATPERKRDMVEEFVSRCPEDAVARGLAHQWGVSASGAEPQPAEPPDEMLLVARKLNECIHRQAAAGGVASTVRVELAGIAKFACWWFVIVSMVGIVAALIAAAR